jgi:hypothetical protein
MTLKPCRACSKAVNDQTEICPNCGTKGPVDRLVTSSTPPKDSADNIILNVSNAVVTRTLAKLEGKNFPLSGRGSAATAAPKIARLITFVVVLFVVGVSMLSDGNGAVGWFFVTSSIALLLIARKYGPFIRTAHGDGRATKISTAREPS